MEGPDQARRCSRCQIVTGARARFMITGKTSICAIPSKASTLCSKSSACAKNFRMCEGLWNSFILVDGSCDMFHSPLSWIATSLRRSAYECLRMDPVRGSTRPAKATALLFTMVSFALVSLAPVTASAGCIIGLSSATCSATAPNPSTDPIGAGPNTPSPYTVLLNPNAKVEVTNVGAISLGDNATITLNRGAVVQTTTTQSDGDQGPYQRGWDAIAVNRNGTITVDAGAAVIAKGVGPTSEAINPFSYGNTIINHGLIAGGPSSAIVFENVDSTANSPRNTVLNFGTIRYKQRQSRRSRQRLLGWHQLRERADRTCSRRSQPSGGQ